MEFSRQEYWSGLPFPSPGDRPNSGIEPGSPALQANSYIWGTTGAEHWSKQWHLGPRDAAKIPQMHQGAHPRKNHPVQDVHEAAVEKSWIHFTSICLALWFPISVNGLHHLFRWWWWFVHIMMVPDVAGVNPPSKLAAWSFWNVPLTLLKYFYSLAQDSQTHLELSLPQAWNLSAISPMSFASFFVCAENGT